MTKLGIEMKRKVTKSVKNRERQESWYLLLTRWQLHWASLGGYLPFFQLAIRDYLARVKVVAEHTQNEELFTDLEIEQRRKLRLHALAELAPGFSDEPKPEEPGRFRRLISALSINNFRGKRNRQHDASSELPVSATAIPPVKDLTVESLFTAKERTHRLKRRIKKLRGGFQQGHKQTLKEFKEYKRVIDSLAFDDIDHEIRQLEYDYIHLGRTREWYGEFRLLTLEVLEVADNMPRETEFNEDPARLLQRDFLTTMNSRLSIYRRLDDLRREVFQLGDTKAIRMLSYFKMKLPAPDEFIDQSQDITVVKQFLASLEYQLGLVRAERAQLERAAVAVETSSEMKFVNHENRLDAWLRFKQGTARDLRSLKQITADCEDWQQAVALFESELEIRRLENHGLSPVSEQSMVQNFVRDMVARIDAEIETDIAFQRTLQQLIVSGQHPEILNLVLERLKLARSSPDAVDQVPVLKSEFLQSHANLTDQQAEVIPLFRR